ncbi:CPBP family intramembrane glutamic endopeptidase [Streptomyces sp. NPDC048350]|uniref:CPBP family intramembrane glutamic endopeptidase n=1 Tax=Streptomyces sp. NPDC048350 TaxID=3365538 RepID=UPI00371EACA7
MHNLTYRTEAYAHADGLTRAEYDKALVGLERARAKQQAAADETEVNWKIVCALLPAVSLIVLITGGFLALLLALLGAALLTFILFWSGTAGWFNLRYCLLAAALGTTCAAARAEIAFRGVLWAMLERRWGHIWATALSSLLFGLWHVLPSRGLTRANAAFEALFGTGPAGVALSVVTAVAGTALAGVLLCELRRRSESLIPPMALHYAVNSTGYVLAWAAGRGWA